MNRAGDYTVWGAGSRRLLRLASFLAVALTLLTLSGVAPRESIWLVAAVFMQTVSGAMWWVLLVGGRTNTIEAGGVGLALGTISALLSAQLLRDTPISTWAWASPIAITALTLFVVRVRIGLRESLGRIDRLARRDWLGLWAAMSAGMTTVAVFWLQTPLTWNGYRAYHPDIVFHEGLAHSVHLFGAKDNVFVVGEAVRYHWFSHAWIGAMSEWARAEPFVVLTRVTPLVALLGAVFVAWSWARRLSALWWVPPLAGTLMSGGSYVGISMNASGGDHLVGGLSPSQSFTTSWMLVFGVTLTFAFRKTLKFPAAVGVLTLISFALVGGKVSHAAMIAGGMVGLFLLAPVSTGMNRLRIFYLCTASALGVIIGYFLIIHGGNGNGFRFGFDVRAGRSLGLEPWSLSWPLQPLGIVFGAFSLIIAIAARLSGLAWFSPDRQRTPEIAFGTGVGISAALLLFFTTQSGAGQLYFALSGSALLTVFSAVGCGNLWALQSSFSESLATHKHFVLALITGASAAVTGFALYELASSLGEIRRPLYALRWLGPVMVWLVIICGLTLCRTRLTGKTRTHFFTAFGVIALMTASVTTLQMTGARSLAGIGAKWVNGSNVGVEVGWHEDHKEAALWLRENSDLTDVIMTNRLCSNVALNAPSCESRWFYTAAFTSRRMWIEGFDYGVGSGSLPGWAKDRIAVVQRAVSAPSEKDLLILQANGVKWFWMDCQVGCDTNELQIGVEVFRNHHVAVTKLQSPVMWGSTTSGSVGKRSFDRLSFMLPQDSPSRGLPPP